MTKGLATVLGLLAAGAGCADQREDYGSTAGTVTYEQWKAGVYQEPSTGFWVLDWDTKIVDETDLRALFDATHQPQALAVYTMGGQDIIWDATKRMNLTYCVSNTFGANKQKVIDAMAAASDQGWEKFARVNYTYVAAQDANCTAANTAVMFDVNPVNSGGQYLARSFFPNDSRDARNVLIDGDSFDPAATGNIPLANILSHELGHTLGFRHEHIRPEANATQCAEDNNFRGVTAYDSASVMHYPQCNGTSTTLSFTDKDKTGVALIYGAPGTGAGPTAQFTFPANNATVAPTFEVSANIVDMAAITSAELLVDGVSTDTATSAPFIFNVSGLALGAHTLQINATDADGAVGTATVTVTVANGGATGNPDGPGGNTVTPGVPNDVVGGCSTGGSTGGLLLIGLAVAFAKRKRR